MIDGRNSCGWQRTSVIWGVPYRLPVFCTSHDPQARANMEKKAVERPEVGNKKEKKKKKKKKKKTWKEKGKEKEKEKKEKENDEKKKEKEEEEKEKKKEKEKEEEEEKEKEKEKEEEEEEDDEDKEKNKGWESLLCLDRSLSAVLLFCRVVAAAQQTSLCPRQMLTRKKKTS